jgi:hypothetical protein
VYARFFTDRKVFLLPTMRTFHLLDDPPCSQNLTHAIGRVVGQLVCIGTPASQPDARLQGVPSTGIRPPALVRQIRGPPFLLSSKSPIPNSPIRCSQRSDLSEK